MKLFKEADHKIKRVDIIFFRWDDGSFVLHRIIDILPNGQYKISGSAQDICEIVKPKKFLQRLFE